MDKTNEAFIIVGAQYQRQTAPAKKTLYGSSGGGKSLLFRFSF